MKIKTVLMAGAVAVSMALAAPAAFAKHDGKSHEESFEVKKTKTLERIDARIADMQKRRECVNGAADKDAMKACLPNRDEWKKKGKHDSKRDKEKPAKPKKE